MSRIGGGIEALGEGARMIIDALQIDLVRTSQRSIAGKSRNDTIEACRGVEDQAPRRAVERRDLPGRDRARDLQGGTARDFQRRSAGEREGRRRWRIDDVNAAVPVVRHSPGRVRIVSNQRDGNGQMLRRIGHCQCSGAVRRVVAAATGCGRRISVESLEVQNVATS